MEHQFLIEQLPEEMFWVETVPVNPSAFVPYTNRSIDELGYEKCCGIIGSNDQNMNNRVMEFLRRNGNVNIEKREPGRERCYKHMIGERMRRENQRQSYLALHHMLPFGTKNEKNSIIQTATVEIQKMERYKEELERRNSMLESNPAVKEEEGGGAAKIRLRVANPSSGIDSMIEVVKCLKELGPMKSTRLHLQFSNLEFSAELEIETTQIGAEEAIEKALQRRLIEVERKHRFYFEEGCGGVR